MVSSQRRVWVVLALLGLAAAARAGGVPRGQCFPVEELPRDERAKAEKVLLDLLDREGLFTVVGGIKPVSEGFWNLSWDVEAGTPDRLAEARRVLAAFRCGDAFYADVLVFKAPAGKNRVAHAYLAGRPALGAKIREEPRFWLRLGVTPESHPAAVVTSVEHAAEADRFRGFGYAFGYPRHAVDFYVAAAESQKSTGEFVKRDFVNLPTHLYPTGRFVWAVPKGHTENAEDRRVRAAAAVVLEAYRSRRGYYIGEGKPGVVALLRDWFDDGTGRCDPANATLFPFVPPAPPTFIGPAACPPVFPMVPAVWRPLPARRWHH